jgi:hypothetical protein
MLWSYHSVLIDQFDDEIMLACLTFNDRNESVVRRKIHLGAECSYAIWGSRDHAGVNSLGHAGRWTYPLQEPRGWEPPAERGGERMGQAEGGDARRGVVDDPWAEPSNSEIRRYDPSQGRGTAGLPHPRQPLVAWTTRDESLLQTCEIAFDLNRGQRPSRLPEVFSPLPPPYPDSQFWAVGMFALLEFRAPGDGTYLRNEGFFFATGRLGLAVTAAGAVARAAGNRSRRRAAEEAVIPRWLVISEGELYLAPSSLTMRHASGLWTWPYSAIRVAQMVEPGKVLLEGQGPAGPIQWVVVSDWAELVFITWAFNYHRRHPQLITGGWLPPGWLARCAEAHRSTRLYTPGFGG